MNFFLAKEFFKHFYKKTDEKSLNSSFFFQFYLKLVKNKSHSAAWLKIESARKNLLKNESEIEIFDLGAGSKVENKSRRKVKSIARHSLSSPKFSQFLYHLIQQHTIKNAIELGTSLGINTAYMASASSETSIFTFEADPASLEIARSVNAGQENIIFHSGDISETLPKMLQKSNAVIDLVYADANHTYEASIQYFSFIQPYLEKHSIYILDDIHWSAGMKAAWDELKNRAEVTSSIDLFDAGILFFNPDFTKEHYTLDF